jgi:hypothetical protein
MNQQNDAMGDTIVPKSDQLNADDLLTGPRDVTFTGFKKTGGKSDVQPVSLNFEGDDGRPYKPCKSMRRVLVGLWGDQGRNYVGKSVRLYTDPEVTFGKVKVGGIRISHASGLQAPFEIVLTVSKSVRKPWVVKPLDRAPGLGQKTAAPQENDIEISEEEKVVLIEAALFKATQGILAYQVFFAGNRDDIAGLSKPERLVLTSTQRPDPNDFDNMKTVHNLCKAIAEKADAEDDVTE